MYERYAELRNKAGVPDYVVAKQTGISPSTLYDWRDGRYTPKVGKLKKIADYFGVSLEYLLGDTQEAG